MTAQANEFEPLPLRRRSVVPISAEEYQIISREGQVKEVKANTAYEAFKLSGFTQAIKIERKAAAKPSVLPKSRFVEEAKLQEKETAPETGDLILKTHKSPVFSADELDRIMTLYSSRQSAEAVDIKDVATIAEMTDSMEAPNPTPIPIVSSPNGMELHGDGFDEIIPSNIVPKSVATPKPTMVEMPTSEPETQQAAPVEQPPEQELTEEQINQLLKG